MNMTPKLITQTKNKTVAKTAGQASLPAVALLVVKIFDFDIELHPEEALLLGGAIAAAWATFNSWLHNTIPNKDDRQRKAEVKRLTAEAQEDLRNQRLAQAVAQVVSTQIKIDQEPPKSDPPTYV